MKNAVAMVCVMLLGTICFAQGTSKPNATAVMKSEDVWKKMNSIIIPEVDFKQAKLPDVVKFLSYEAKKNDADKTGVNIVLVEQWNKTEITMTVHNVSLLKVLSLVAEMSGLSISVEDNIVTLRHPREQKK